MIKPRNVVIPAVIGFIFSFLISLIASNGFFHSLLRGVLFAVAFAALAAGVSFLYQRFLSDGTSGESAPQSSSGTKNEKVGSIVDLTVSDEALADDGQGPQFFVANNKHTLSDEDLQKEPSVDVSSGSDSKTTSPQEGEISSLDDKEFKRIDLGASFSAKGGTSSVEEKTTQKSGAEQVEATLEEANLSGDDIDELPDIGNVESEPSKEEAEDAEVINDSDFAVAGKHKRNSNAEFPDGSNAKNHDADTMAKAIRTLLKKEE